MRQPCVYILASQRNGTLYTGVTRATTRRGGNMAKRFETTPRGLERTEMSGLLAVRRAPRVWEHKNDQAEGFAYKYRVHRLVYFEQHEDMNAAITREKQIKKWKRACQLRLIEERNPGWIDLYETLI